MPQGFTWCTPNTPYTLQSSIPVAGTVLHLRFQPCSPQPSSIPVHRTISPGLFGPVHQIRLAAPFTSTVLRPRFQLCSPDSSPELFSILVPGTVHHPRHLNRSPSPSPQPFSILVSATVLHPRLRYRSPSQFSAAQFFWM